MREICLLLLLLQTDLLAIAFPMILAKLLIHRLLQWTNVPKKFCHLSTRTQHCIFKLLMRTLHQSIVIQIHLQILEKGIEECVIEMRLSEPLLTMMLKRIGLHSLFSFYVLSS